MALPNAGMITPRTFAYEVPQSQVYVRSALEKNKGLRITTSFQMARGVTVNGQHAFRISAKGSNRGIMIVYSAHDLRALTLLERGLNIDLVEQKVTFKPVISVATFDGQYYVEFAAPKPSFFNCRPKNPVYQVDRGTYEALREPHQR